MQLGLIGRGVWGGVYARNLGAMDVPFWQAGRDFRGRSADGIIIASEPHSHFVIAREFIKAGVPVLIEKPMCMNAADATELLHLVDEHAGIGMVGHTRLYSPAWRTFKAHAQRVGVQSVFATAGGPCQLSPWWDWGPHLAALCFDLGVDPIIRATSVPTPLKVVVNNMLAFDDPPTEPMPLRILLSEFMSAIAEGKPHSDGIKMGLRVVEFLERRKCYGR